MVLRLRHPAELLRYVELTSGGTFHWTASRDQERLGSQDWDSWKLSGFPPPIRREGAGTSWGCLQLWAPYLRNLESDGGIRSSRAEGLLGGFAISRNAWSSAPCGRAANEASVHSLQLCLPLMFNESVVVKCADGLLDVCRTP